MSANFLLTSWNAGIKIRVTVMENHKKRILQAYIYVAG
jgi:hypothetical protein